MLLGMMFCVGCATGGPKTDAPLLDFQNVEKGEPAPYTGYLANQETLEAIDAALIDLEDCEKQQNKQWWEKTLAGGKGFLLGALVGYAVGGN